MDFYLTTSASTLPTEENSISSLCSTVSFNHICRSNYEIKFVRNDKKSFDFERFLSKISAIENISEPSAEI